MCTLPASAALAHPTPLPYPQCADVCVLSDGTLLSYARVQKGEASGAANVLKKRASDSKPQAGKYVSLPPSRARA